MRSTADRIRHTLLFEGIAVLAVVAFSLAFLEFAPGAIASLTIAMSLLAMAWNYLYNLGFDLWLLKSRGHAGERSLSLRVGHAVGFESGMLLLGVPLVAWWLGIGLWQALLMDIGFAVFFLVYALVFNWAYDRVFPLPPELAASCSGCSR